MLAAKAKRLMPAAAGQAGKQARLAIAIKIGLVMPFDRIYRRLRGSASWRESGLLLNLRRAWRYFGWRMPNH